MHFLLLMFTDRWCLRMLSAWPCSGCARVTESPVTRFSFAIAVLLLATCSPPERLDNQRPPVASVPEPLKSGQESDYGVRCRQLLLPTPRRPQLEFKLYDLVTHILAQWLRCWLPLGTNFCDSVDGGFGGGNFKHGEGSGTEECMRRSSRNARISRGWGVRLARADLVDAGGVNVDGTGFRGGRQATASSSKSYSADGRPNGRSTVETGNAASGAAGIGSGGVCSDSCPLVSCVVHFS